MNYGPVNTPAPPGYHQLSKISTGRTYATAFSFVGSTRRITGWTRDAVDGQHQAVVVLGWTVAAAAIPLAWIFVLCWYSVIFGFFGIVAIPWRILRRGQRRNRHLMEQQTAYMQHMAYATAANQSVAMAQAAPPQPAVMTPPPAITAPRPQVAALPTPRPSSEPPSDARSAVLEVLADADGEWLTAREIAEAALDLGWEASGSDSVAPIRTAASRLATDGEIHRQMRNGRTAEFAYDGA